MLPGFVARPGTLALEVITAGAPAAIAARNGGMATDCSFDQGSVRAGPSSVFRLACPSPGKCLITGITPPLLNPSRYATVSLLTVAVRPLKDRSPSGLLALGTTERPSTSATGARSMFTPAAAIFRATL